jgi:hypothetical protein
MPLLALQLTPEVEAYVTVIEVYGGPPDGVRPVMATGAVAVQHSVSSPAMLLSLRAVMSIAMLVDAPAVVVVGLFTELPHLIFFAVES